MRQAVAALLALAAAASACSDGKASAPTVAPTTSTQSVTTPSETNAPTASAPTPTEPTTTEAPATTIDDATILADVEAAYLEGFRVAIESLRNPSDPENETRLGEYFMAGNLDKAVENLRLTVDGGFVARENPDNPSFAIVVEGAIFIDGDVTAARITVCEFNSDRIYEVGTAPDGGDTLRFDDPVSLLFVTQMELVGGQWKSRAGGETNEIRDETEQCTGA